MTIARKIARISSRMIATAIKRIRIIRPMARNGRPTSRSPVLRAVETTAFDAACNAAVPPSVILRAARSPVLRGVETRAFDAACIAAVPRAATANSDLELLFTQTSVSDPRFTKSNRRCDTLVIVVCPTDAISLAR
jgi:hypothetical protein